MGYCFDNLMNSHSSIIKEPLRNAFRNITLSLVYLLLQNYDGDYCF